jgi:hypothetical protein
LLRGYDDAGRNLHCRDTQLRIGGDAVCKRLHGNRQLVE